MKSLKILLAGLSAVFLMASTASANDIQLVLVEQPGCAYCAAWDDQIAPAYPKTDEGQFAPLVRADLHMGPPEGVTYARKVTFTPTFILVKNGAEIARMEGYVGEDFFWPVYAELLKRHTTYAPSGGE